MLARAIVLTAVYCIAQHASSQVGATERATSAPTSTRRQAPCRARAHRPLAPKLPRASRAPPALHARCRCLSPRWATARARCRAGALVGSSPRSAPASPRSPWSSSAPRAPWRFIRPGPSELTSGRAPSWRAGRGTDRRGGRRRSWRWTARSTCSARAAGLTCATQTP